MMTFFLTPFSWIWTLGLKHRLNVPSYKVKVPVICIGNINLGGVGKTPAVIAFTEKLKEKTNQLNIANENLKRLARDLANAENKLNDTGNPTVADDKYTKLTALLKTKSNEIREMKKENKEIRQAFGQRRVRAEASSKPSLLEA